MWRRTLEYGGVLVLALGGTAVVYGAALGDRDIIEVLAFMVVAAVLFQLLAGWLAGPIRDTGSAVGVSRGAAVVLALAVAIVLAWPRGDWIPDNDPGVTDSFVAPSVNVAQVWIYFLPGYAVVVLVLLVAFRVGRRRAGRRLGAPSPPTSPSAASASDTPSGPATPSAPGKPRGPAMSSASGTLRGPAMSSASGTLRGPAMSSASGKPGEIGRVQRGPVGEAADLLVMGLPMAAILLLEGLLPLPGDGLAYNAAVLLAAAWCATSTLVGAAWLTRRAGVARLAVTSPGSG